jgi:hypothetical protein
LVVERGLARRLHLSPGDRTSVKTTVGTLSLRVAGVAVTSARTRSPLYPSGLAWVLPPRLRRVVPDKAPTARPCSYGSQIPPPQAATPAESGRITPARRRTCAARFSTLRTHFGVVNTSSSGSRARTTPSSIPSKKIWVWNSVFSASAVTAFTTARPVTVTVPAPSSLIV